MNDEANTYNYLLSQWHDLCKAFLMEAKWHYSNYKPTLHEYLENGWISVSGPLMLIHVFPVIEKKGVVTPNPIQQLESYPKLVQMVSKIFRLCNDSATHSVRTPYVYSCTKFVRSKQALVEIYFLHVNVGRARERRCAIFYSHLHVREQSHGA